MVKFVPSLLLVFFLAVVQASPILAETHRVAVLPSPELEDAGAMLTAALSSHSGVEVMERSQLEAIVREKALQRAGATAEDASHIGQILGVDALIFLDQAGGTLTARMVAVGSGVAVAAPSTFWPIGDPAGWARFWAERFVASLTNLPKAPREKILLSVLGIRSPVGGAAPLELVRETSFSVNRTLARLPGVFALDRTRLRESDWEKQVKNATSISFWASSWLFDGSLTSVGNRLILDGRLQPLGGGAARTFRVEANDAMALGDVTAAEIAKQLQTPATSAAEVRSGETEQFQAEAEWAFRWKLYNQAERAADASWFLGNRSEAVGLIRAKSPAANGIGRVQTVVDNFILTSKEPPEAALNEMIRAFSNFQSTAEAVGGKGSPRFYAEFTEILEMASALLQVYYYLPRDRTPEEQERLRWLRGEIRKYIPMMITGNKMSYAALKPYEQRNLAGSADQPPASFFADYGWYAPLWSENPEDSAEALKAAFDTVDQLDPVLGTRLRTRIVKERSSHKPLVVAWEKADRARVSETRSKLLADLQKKGPRSKLDALTLQAALYWHFGMPELQQKVPKEKVRQALSDFYLGLIDLRKQIIDGTLSMAQVMEAIDEMSQMANEEEFAEVQPTVATLQKKFFLSLLKEKWVGKPEIYNRLINYQVYTPQERDEIFQAIAEIQKGLPKPSSYLSHYQERVGKQTSGATPTPSPTLLAQKGLAPTRSYSVFSDSESSPHTYLDGVRRHGSTFFVRKISAAPSWDVEILALDPSSEKARLAFKSPNSEVAWPLVNAAWDVDDRNLYFANDGKLSRIDLGSGKIETKATPLLNGQVQNLFAVGGQVYAILNEGGIVRINPATLEVELLASARRRPATTPLDDRQPYGVSAAFADDGGVIFVVSNEVYLWEERTRTFRKLPMSTVTAPSFAYDRTFFLKWIGASRTNTSGHLMFLFDPGRTGRVPRMLGVWPPPIKLQGQEKYGSQILSSTAAGSTLYVLFTGGPDDGRYFKIIGETRDFWVPVPATASIQSSGYIQTIATEDGVLIWGRDARDLPFYSLKDLESNAH